MSDRQHRIEISADTKTGVSLHGLTDNEVDLIEIALSGGLNRHDKDEALELCIEIRKAWNIKWGRKHPSEFASRKAVEILDKILPQPKV